MFNLDCEFINEVTAKSHVTSTGFQLEAAALVVALIAAAGLVLSFMFIRRMRPHAPTSQSDPTSPPADPTKPMTKVQQALATETANMREESQTTEPLNYEGTSATPETREPRDTP